MNWFAKREIPYDPRAYKDHRGIIVEKYRSFLGKYIVVIEDNSGKIKLCVGQGFMKTWRLVLNGPSEK